MQALRAIAHSNHACPYRSSAGSGGRYGGVEPLLALRRTTLMAAGCFAAVPAALMDAAKVARRAGQLHHGMAAVQELRSASLHLSSHGTTSALTLPSYHSLLHPRQLLQRTCSRIAHSASRSC